MTGIGVFAILISATIFFMSDPAAPSWRFPMPLWLSALLCFVAGVGFLIWGWVLKRRE